MSLQAGQIVADKYRIVRMLGQGGMGEVYEGENLRIHRRVAIKTLLSGVSGRTDVVQRFEREAQAAGRIGSDHIVEVLDLGDLPDGSRYMVMEFLDGTTLSERIVSRGRVSARESARIVIELCEGLAAAHQAGIIHRDLKPANVFLLTSKQGRQDFVKILDFGVSKFSVLGDEMSMTRTGAVVGTPYYMSPEQAKGAKAIDARSDLYSVGVILYESITGQVPFNAQTFNELIFKIALESPPPPESFVPDLDPQFASIVRKAMAREPAERYQSAVEFKAALEAWTQGYDRAAAAGAIGPGGAYLQSPVGFAQGGSTQIMNPSGIAPSAAVAPALGGHTAIMAPQAPALRQAAPSKGSAGVAFLVALSLVLVIVGGGAVAAVVMLKGRAKTSVTTSTTPSSEPIAAPTASATTAAPTSPTSTATASVDEAGSATSVSSLPNAGPDPSTRASGHVATGQGHVPIAKPTSAPVAPPTSQPTAKPTSGRPITGDL